jgi:glycine cleavage system transcriptional repressor
MVCLKWKIRTCAALLAYHLLMAWREILVATGADRPGVVDEVSLFLLDRGGNIRDSKMTNLGGRFAIIAEINGSEEALARIRRELPEIGHQLHMHLELHAEDQHAVQAYRNTAPHRLIASGKDQAGVLYRMSHLLRVLNINIDDIRSTLGEAADEAAPPFVLELLLSVPKETPITMLRDYLSHLCQQMHINWELEAM